MHDKTKRKARARARAAAEIKEKKLCAPFTPGTHTVDVFDQKRNLLETRRFKTARGAEAFLKRLDRKYLARHWMVEWSLVREQGDFSLKPSTLNASLNKINVRKRADIGVDIDTYADMDD